MATLKITLNEVVTTQKEIEVNFPFYIKDKAELAYIVYFNDSKYIKVNTAINAIYESESSLQSILQILQSGWTPCLKHEFNEALEKVSKNFDALYEQVLEAQVKPMVKDECEQRADLEDAKGQEALENYLNK